MLYSKDILMVSHEVKEYLVMRINLEEDIKVLS